MVKITDITEKELSSDIYGGKAAGLSLLMKYGFQVPDGIAIEAVDNTDCLDQSFQNDLSEKLKKFDQDGSYVIAVRSSCTLEDSFSESAAGRYHTFLGWFSFQEVMEAIRTIVHSLYLPGSRMGIVIQRLIHSDYSGVIFSSDPLTYKKDTLMVSYVRGVGDKLVSGAVPGKDILVSYRDGKAIVDDVNADNLPELIPLCQSVKKLENVLKYPIDVEWSVCQGKVYYLQCRPLSVITGISSKFIHVDIDNIKKLPERLIVQMKLDIWRRILELGIRMPHTYLYIHNYSNKLEDDVQWNMEKTEQCKGYSAVILYPENLVEVCSFLGDRMKVKENLSKCCRYGIRAFPRYESIKECLNYYNGIIDGKSWIGMIMLQETINPLYTGSICKVQDGYMIEITHGNFITKGIVPVSSYIIGHKEDIISKKEVDQSSWYEVVEGHTVYCICNEGKYMRVSLPNNVIIEVLQYFQPLLEEFNKTIEFAILRNKMTGEHRPYFIDFADCGKDNYLSLENISSGIISQGRAVGKIVYIERDKISFLCENQDDEAKIFFCKRPDIALLPIIDQYPTEKIAFVFEEGSVLCHLATVLREKGIPAVQIGYYSLWEYPEGRICEIDAQSENYSGKTRLSLKCI